MNGDNWAQILVALVAVISAFLAQRSAKNAAKLNSDATITNSKTLAETEAYNRARKMDVETIERQDEDIRELRENSNKLREKYRELKQDNELLHEDNDRLRRRVTALERQIGETNEQHRLHNPPEIV